MGVRGFEYNNKGGRKMTTTMYKPYYNLKGLMAKNNIRQKQMADMVGMDPSTFNFKINRTNGRDFTLDESIKIAEILGVKVDDFF